MDEKLIRAYLWHDVIRLGFCPSSVTDKKNWLLQYSKSLRDFWEIDLYPRNPYLDGDNIKLDIDFDPLDLCLEFVFKSMNNFCIQFEYCSKTPVLKLMHDVDLDNYFVFPDQSFLTLHGQRRMAVNELSNSDIEVVIDGLLLHTAAHMHIHSPIDRHDIRIGGGICNPFQYLFHLRYQLCPSPRKREAERNRLIDLFSAAIREDFTIRVNDLMAEPDMSIYLKNKNN